jgi:hypothetical protein
MTHPRFFLDLPEPDGIRRAFLESGATFDRSPEDRRRCGLALDDYFAESHSARPAIEWFMPVLFGGANFRFAPPWSVLMSMGIYGYLASGSPDPVPFSTGTMTSGYHVLQIAPAKGYQLQCGQRRPHPVTDAMLRIPSDLDTRVWTDLYGLSNLREEVRFLSFTLVAQDDLSAVTSGVILFHPEPRAFLNPLRSSFSPEELEAFFSREPDARRWDSHRERLGDLFSLPLDLQAANLDTAVQLIRDGFGDPSGAALTPSLEAEGGV